MYQEILSDLAVLSIENDIAQGLNYSDLIKKNTQQQEKRCSSFFLIALVIK